MPAKLPNSLKNVIDQFTPDVRGVLWITQEELSQTLLGFDELNYLFDGLLSQFIYGQVVNQVLLNANIFFTQNFNQTLFLAHIKVNINIKSNIDEQLALLAESSNKNNKIIVYDTTDKIRIAELTERYPRFDFISLSL